jgi:hypothetical protein
MEKVDFKIQDILEIRMGAKAMETIPGTPQTILDTLLMRTGAKAMETIPGTPPLTRMRARAMERIPDILEMRMEAKATIRARTTTPALMILAMVTEILALFMTPESLTMDPGSLGESQRHHGLI